ncbi:MAG: hypothetical protein LBH42_01415 [Treponema sp.]|jgi:predicted  nucleic acid-binding Zn-ribbon protein|nr:hypothetical protein [Treponema sp.]
MDDRKAVIRELEEKNRADTEARKRLFERLGETLIQRIGEGAPFLENAGETPGGLLAEYRKLLKDIAESEDIIKSLEADIHRLKELEEEISGKEGELSRLRKELDEVNGRLGKALLEAPASDLEVFDATLKQQEELLLAKIDELEKKLEDLEGQEGGLFAWLGKNAKAAVSKGFLLRNRSALQRLYRSAGEKYISSESQILPEGAAAGAVEKARQLTEQVSSLSVSLSILKGERRNIGDVFGGGGSPARRIHGQEKHIAHVKGEFPGVYFRFGSLAANDKGNAALSSMLMEEDRFVLERAGIIASEISKRELSIKKLNAAISVDDEKAEIERMKKAIQNQRQRIAAAEETISGFEKQIVESEQHIEDLNEFIRNNGGI